MRKRILDPNLTRSEAARVAHMRRRILAAFATATAADLAAGLAWYDRAADAAGSLGVSVETGAGVIAALSPRCHWRTNLAWAARMIDAAQNGERTPDVHTRAMRRLARRIADGEHALDVLNGPKTRAFFANITGDTRRVTVDVWAAAIAEGTLRTDRKRGTTGVPADADPPTGRRYYLIERAYQETADLLGIAPRDLQAAVWVAVRGSAD